MVTAGSGKTKLLSQVFTNILKITQLNTEEITDKKKMFNLLGQEVAVLVDRELPAGYQVVTWDASKASSGIYLYRLQAGNYIETKKLLLLK